MKNSAAVAFLIGISIGSVVSCSSNTVETEVTTLPALVSARPQTAGSATNSPSILPDGAEVDRKAALLMGIDVHRQLWATRPTDNYKFGFQWNVGDYAYQTANVEVRIIKGEVDRVSWAENAVRTDGSEPDGFIVPNEPEAEDYYSVDGLFKLIEEGVKANPSRISLGFDSVFGFPTSVIIEFPVVSERKDISFFAAQLVPIPGPPE